MQYRKEIDGLRALAVLPVIFYHAGWQTFQGGFVGVDIFFVISGFLITQIIVSDWQAGNYSLIHFYERRVRRILPALFFMLLVCLPFALWVLLPHELMAFARSVIAVILFVSNLLFWKESNYFSPDAEVLPLLHTWSLAVEEQFYVLYPLLLIVLLKNSRKLMGLVLMGLALASLFLSEYLWRAAPEANFFLLPSRAWELLVGALAALYGAQVAHHTGLFKELAAALGLVLIALGIFFIHDDLPFPSVYSLIPTLGAALILLWADQHTYVGRWLSLKPWVGVGLISYSAYLWHQPLFALTRLWLADEPNQWLMLGLIGLTLSLAYMSWRFVERPFREKGRFTRRQVFSFACLAALAFVSIATILLYSKGLPARFS
ncbi:acyltransferase family protein [Thiolinea disciformis]|uniref:acyltransferase family protein n=1 Tax=Thiolinea disciformis TaxID=125614 RepID=UPI00036DDB9A|nr:acyltransferase [Thiolinea disciformis]